MVQSLDFHGRAYLEIEYGCYLGHHVYVNSFLLLEDVRIYVWIWSIKCC